MDEKKLKEFNAIIGLAESHARAATLYHCLNVVDDELGVELLENWFNMCDMIGSYATKLKSYFLKFGWVSDTAEKPELPVKVYRAAWEGDDPHQGLSWTTDRDFAENFARGLFSPRNKFVFGTFRPNTAAVVWEATCEDALAYFIGRGESEIIPREVIDPVVVARFIEVKDEEIAG